MYDSSYAFMQENVTPQYREKFLIYLFSHELVSGQKYVYQ